MTTTTTPATPAMTPKERQDRIIDILTPGAQISADAVDLGDEIQSLINQIAALGDDVALTQIAMSALGHVSRIQGERQKAARKAAKAAAQAAKTAQ